jgi:hypothetical protein
MIYCTCRHYNTIELNLEGMLKVVITERIKVLPVMDNYFQDLGIEDYVK